MTTITIRQSSSIQSVAYSWTASTDCRYNGLQYQMLCDPGGTGSSAGLLWPPEDHSEF